MAQYLPTMTTNGSARTSRGLEVPNANFSNGANYSFGNAPGIGIMLFQTNLPPLIDGKPDMSNWTLLTQGSINPSQTGNDFAPATRAVQASQVIGGAAFIDRATVAWPSSGGKEGNGEQPTAGGFNFVNVTNPANIASPDPQVQGTVPNPAPAAGVGAQIRLDTLATGWTNVTPP